MARNTTNGNRNGNPTKNERWQRMVQILSVPLGREGAISGDVGISI
jgi:hypothetical protein